MLRWTLTYGSQSLVINNDPVGWEEMTISYIRSAKYFGIFKEISEELGFFCNDGGNLIKSAFDTDGFEADVEVLLEYQCADGQSYDVIMDGRASMDSYRVSQLNEADIVYVKLENNDLSYKIMSRDGVPINLKSLTGLDGQALTAYTYDSNPIDIFRRLELISILQNDQTGIYTGQATIFLGGVQHTGLFCPQLATVQTDLTTVTDTDTQFLLEPEPNQSQKLWFLNYGGNFTPMFKATTTDVIKWPSPLRIDYSVSGEFTDANAALSRSFAVNLEIFVGPNLLVGSITGPIVTRSIVPFASYNVVVNQTFSFTGAITIPSAPEGYEVYAFIVIRNYAIATGNVGQSVTYDFLYDITEWDFTFTSSNEFPQSSADSLLIHEAFSRSLESISGQSKAFYSTLLGRKNSQPYSYSSNGCHSFIGVTNGLNVRGKTEPIVDTIETMYDSIDSIGNVGLGVEPDPNGGNFSVARLEEKSYFFDGNTLLLTLSGLTDVKEYLWIDEIFNEVEVGYETWQPFAVTGLDEPLTKQTYQNIIKNIKKALELKCPAIMSMNLIEIIRRFGTDQNITQDLSQDEMAVWIALNRSVDGDGNPNNLTTQEKDENFSTITNLTESTTALNLRYSPKRNLARHLNRLAVSLVDTLSPLFRYASGEGNQAMTTTMIADGCAGDYSGQLLTEDAAISWNDSNVRNNTPLFEPILYDFSIPLSYTEYNTIKANPKGYIRGLCADGTAIEGFVKQVDYKLESGFADITLIKKYGS